MLLKLLTQAVQLFHLHIHIENNKCIDYLCPVLIENTQHEIFFFMTAKTKHIF